ncbi:MAG TPA: flagellar hook-basal body complex protein [Sphingomonadaceae bacterium]|nr:flagellar hook-basal body complex protein [Sphingomonadaceae bacterium]
MFGSIYVGLSGLNAYSKGLQQVSSNITNLNSSGFKASTVTFTDQFSVRSNNLANANSRETTGRGVDTGRTQLDYKQGELRQTNRDLDLAVDGNGFLMLTRGEEVAYTRTGSFEVDKDGFIVLAGTDYRLATIDGSGRAVSLSIDASRTSPPKPTTTIKFADNLSSTATTHALGDIKVIDKQGGEHVWQVQFAKKADGAPDEWTVTVTDAKAKVVGAQTLKFNGGIVDPATAKLVFADEENGTSVMLDLSENVTSFSSGQVSTLRTASVDGYKSGTITSVGVNDKGALEIGYSNEQKKDLGAVAIADFRDPQALEQRSGGLFADTGRAGRQVAGSEDVRVGRVLSRRLEASNVDLAKQFGDLILIQRGFQASSQIISVSNDMIQQLFGIRGQG